MPVFDFSSPQEKPAEEKKPGSCEIYYSESDEASVEHPFMILDHTKEAWPHHSSGFFTNPELRTCFTFETPSGPVEADILGMDSRFVNLIQWLGRNRIHVRLSGQNTEKGYSVYKIRETLFGNGSKLSGEDGFLQFMIRRLLSSRLVEEETEDEEELTGDDMKLTSIASITDFLACAGQTLPGNIRVWARRNLAVARSMEVSQEERRHAQHALSIMMNVQWKS